MCVCVYLSVCLSVCLCVWSLIYGQAYFAACYWSQFITVLVIFWKYYCSRALAFTGFVARFNVSCRWQRCTFTGVLVIHRLKLEACFLVVHTLMNVLAIILFPILFNSPALNSFLFFLQWQDCGTIVRRFFSGSGVKINGNMGGGGMVFALAQFWLKIYLCVIGVFMCFSTLLIRFCNILIGIGHILRSLSVTLPMIFWLFYLCFLALLFNTISYWNKNLFYSWKI